ncbi:A-kinase anchor protein 13 isoform X2 [Synchiropus splendidus]|uniref:A-kinase anchor protein 13 isoform X2 n=1 Tax=Synchiropus splendidus TaxID=270530 RepID=UPI00237D5A24|nr:A-kinase anchor protein 13 isoform X2 [Synchiropus splendidus]
MKLTPKQAPLYGQCVLTVQLTREELSEDEDATRYFLLFSGSTQSHLTSTVRSGPGSLQAVCPAHDCCEVVSVTLCSLQLDPQEEPVPCLGRAIPVAEQRFSFVQDLAFDMAQFLVSTAGRADGLEGALLLDECQIPLRECERLDQSLSLALRHLPLPAGWSLLGSTFTNSSDVEPRETLLHFSSRRGLCRVTRFLLQQPGARDALRLANRQGLTPAALAQQRGHAGLLQLLTQAEEDPTSDPGQEPDGRLLSNLPALDTHTLTLTPGGDRPSLQASVEQLLRLQRGSVLDQESGSGVSATQSLGCVEKLQPGSSEGWGSQESLVPGSVEEACPRVSCESGPQDHGPVPPQDWVCLSSNRQRERKETEPVSSDGSEADPVEGGLLPLGTSTPAVRDQHAEVPVQEGRGGTPGLDLSEQEAGEDSAMGQSYSSDGSARDDSGEFNGAVSLPGRHPHPSVTECGDVIRSPDLLLIEGPTQGEPPTHTLEQNQETAGGDYETGSSPELAPDSGNWAVVEPSGDDMEPVCGADRRPETSVEGLQNPEVSGSDDDCSFQSLGSSTTDIYLPTLESTSLEDAARSSGLDQEGAGTELSLSSPERTGSASGSPQNSPSSPLDLSSTGTVLSEASESGLGSSLLPVDQVGQESWAEGAPGVPDSSVAELELEVDVSEPSGAAVQEEDRGSAEKADVSMMQRDAEASLHQPLGSDLSGFPRFSSGCDQLPPLHSDSGSCTSTPFRDLGSDLESFLSPEPGYDGIFLKPDDKVTGGDSASEVSVSCSSTDDAASVGPSGSSSPEDSQALSCSWSPEVNVRPGRTAEVEDEAKDCVAEVPRRSGLLRKTLRSLSPLRRHSWGPGKNQAGDSEMNQRSYSLEGLSGVQDELRGPTSESSREPSRISRHDSDERGSLVSLTEEQEEGAGHPGLDCQKSRRYRPLRSSCSPMTLPLTKSVSMLTISHRDIDAVGRLRRRRRISFSFSLSPILTRSKSRFSYGESSTSDDDEDNTSMKSYGSASGSLAYSISEEEPGPLRAIAEPKSVTKVGRTFSYIKNKMYKKTREKDREKKETKEKKSVNGHQFSTVSSALHCSQCSKSLSNKEAFHCTHCGSSVHKACRDNLPPCAQLKTKMLKQPVPLLESSAVPTVTLRKKTGVSRDRPWSAILSPDDHSSLLIPSSRRHASIMGFSGNSMSKSLSISNIAGPVLDEMPIRGLRYLSQSTDSLNRSNQVTESMESLTDEGTEMMDGQLMGEFEVEAKELESDSWSLGVEAQFLQQLDKDLVKRQDIIYELMQTEMHHIRTLRIMSEVYSKGLQKEVQLEQQTLDRLFPVLDELLELHTQYLSRLLERKRESLLEGDGPEGVFIIHRIGDVLLSQFSDSSGERMKRTYGRFCSRHSEAVSLYKELLAKEKRFKTFIKKKMSSSIVRRLGIPACILLVTQRITKYPVLIQRLLQHTREGDRDHEDLTKAVRLVKDVIAAVDRKVNEHEKKRRLKDVHCRTDSKSIMMMKSGQMFAREDLLRRRLIHDGPLQLKSSQGRLKDVHALLLSDVIVFLQEKDQRYVFALLDQRSTVISLQKLIVREVANRDRGLFLITAGIERPEMMEVLASSRDERNTWMQLIQEAMQSMEKDEDEDEGIPSETEEDKRQLGTKAREMRDLLKQKDTEIMSLLEEKVRLFSSMWDSGSLGEDLLRQTQPFFRSTSSLEPPRGASIMQDALQEVETLQALVNGSLGGAMAAGPVSLPRRAETFGGFDSHQMHSSKSGERDESEDTMGELRRTESDSVLKKGGNNNNLLLLLKRNSEQVLHSVSSLHLLLSSLQAVVVQQDSFIEDQRQALTERCPSSRPSSRPSSLIEQEKQRSLEKQRQEAAALQRQQAAHAEEKRRKEREWELREQDLGHKEALLQLQEQEVLRQRQQLELERQELHSRKEQYQRDLERLRDAQRRLERQLDTMQERPDECRVPGGSVLLDPLELSVVPVLPPPPSKPKVKSLNPFTANTVRLGEGNNQLSRSLLQLKSKDSKERKKKKSSKGGGSAVADSQHLPEAPLDGEIFFC